MDPVTLIVEALAAGSAEGVSGTAGTSVKDAYTGLRERVRGWFGGFPSRELALVEHARNPRTWRVPLQDALTESGAAGDPTVVEAAQRLMALLDAAGTRLGKYRVDLRAAEGVQVGDQNTQTNYFHVAEQPLPPTPYRVRTSLPADVVAFIGRIEQVDAIITLGGQVTDAVVRGGVVTIHGGVQTIDGMPGIGKTALAVHVAHQLAGRFPDGLLFIDLHAHTPGSQPIAAFEALGGLLATTG